MQPNKTKIALIIGAMYLGVSGASMAATGTFDITVTTIADVTLEERAILNFGTNIFTTAGTCLMNGAGNAESIMQIDSATGAAPTTVATTYGALSGGGCVTGSNLGTPGLYRISGATGTTVNITMSNATGTGWSFSPTSAFAGNYNTGTATEDDTVTAMTATTTNVRSLAAVADGTDAVVDGQLVFAVGGLLTVSSTLTASQAYTAPFVVSVVY
jgi:hypothetical protein